MPLNACTIDGFTLHGKNCRNKFATLVPILHPPVPPVAIVGGNGRVLRDGFNIPRPFDFEEERPTLVYEQPQITVTVKFDGITAAQTLDNAPQLDFVSIAGFSIKTATLDTGIIFYTDVEDEVTVNILDFKVTQ